jgi:hypothetical protein
MPVGGTRSGGGGVLVGRIKWYALPGYQWDTTEIYASPYRLPLQVVCTPAKR